ncbi:MAG: YkgJ family cysteine cluster protein [Desulfovibrio sp.]|jgi:Fe-S-cluster containining protein|nr:YkgJ family cysteine cluster protein [Desulfovibrio sp.]
MADESHQNAVFQCRMCGRCCEGRGGIVASPEDIARLSAFLHLTSEELVARYGEQTGGKVKIRAGDTDCCVFFTREKGCTVHEAKPAVCRAWPYFRGNILDSESLGLAKAFCPGISPYIRHDDFARLGREYLRENKLLASNPACEATALILP